VEKRGVRVVKLGNTSISIKKRELQMTFHQHFYKRKQQEATQIYTLRANVQAVGSSAI
jgi:hypothetical protein